MFYLAGIIITFFLALILWTKKGKTIADVVLAAWLCVMGVHLFLYYLHITGDIYKHSYLLGVQFPLPLLHGPFLYLYTVTVTHEKKYVSKKILAAFSTGCHGLGNIDTVLYNAGGRKNKRL